MLTGTLIAVRLLQRRLPADAAPGQSGGLLLAGIGAAVLVAAFTTWRRSASLASDAHRAAVGIVSVFGALTVVFLLSTRIERLAGLAGLAAMAAACAVGGFLGDRWAAKGGETGNEKGETAIT